MWPWYAGEWLAWGFSRPASSRLWNHPSEACHSFGGLRAVLLAREWPRPRWVRIDGSPAIAAPGHQLRLAAGACGVARVEGSRG
jgi:hypothetical protein